MKTKISDPQVFEPENLGELLSVSAARPDASLFAGGIEFMRAADYRQLPPVIIDLASVSELKRISRTENYMDIGPTLPVSHILSIGRHVIQRPIYDALNAISPPAIRNIATLGGNICSASPYSDPMVALFALDSQVEVRNASSNRWIPIARFILDQGKTSLNPGEVLTKIRIPFEDWNFQVFKEVTPHGRRLSATLIFCGLARIIKEIIQDIRFSFGAVNTTVIRDRELETPLVGHRLPIQEREIKYLKSALELKLDPIRSSSPHEVYQRKTTMRMFQWFLEELNHYHR
ncbi:MAG TPA: FAD binding domain-containing protein [Spirochaetia bacterium]|nr:FAD binding domain-containing protein [Spirochaetia bacterium]